MRSILTILILFTIYSCSTSSGASDHQIDNSGGVINHFNVMIAVDLSNRQNLQIHPRPLSDDVIIKKLIDNIYPTILNHGRSQNQLDHYSIKIINKQLVSTFKVNSSALSITFDNFKGQKERIDYIKNRPAQTGFSSDTAKLLTEFRRIQKNAIQKSHGADIWTFLNEGISTNDIITKTTSFSYEGRNYTEQFRNVLVVLTDGYIEADFYGRAACDPQNPKQCFYLSGKRIDKFRDAFKASVDQDIAKFFNTSGAGIVPVKNPALQNLEVLILELHDRSLSSGGNATAHPTDMEILKLFWNDWLTRSGVKRFEIWQSMITPEEVERVTLNFLNIEKKPIHQD